MATTSTQCTLDRERIRELIEREEERLNERTQALEARCSSAPTRSLCGGVASSYQLRDPWPIYLERGAGPEGLGRRRQRDVRLPQRLRLDGPGPRPPGDRRRGQPSATARARTSPRRPRTRSSSPRSSRERWGLPQWRYTNSGSESTMDAIRIARAYTGRDTIVKIFGSYHGHHDARDGLDRRRVRPDRRPREPRLAALRRGHPAGRRRPHDRRPVQRRRRDGAPHRAPRRRGPQARLRDHGGGDDEPRGRAARARLPRGGARDHRSATASS